MPFTDFEVVVGWLVKFGLLVLVVLDCHPSHFFTCAIFSTRSWHEFSG